MTQEDNDGIAIPGEKQNSEDEFVSPLEEADNIFEKIDAIFHGDCVECARGRAYVFLGMSLLLLVNVAQFSVIIYLLCQLLP